MSDMQPASGEDLFAGQPVRVVERNGVRYTLLGTAHVSHASVQAVEAAIDSGRFDAVAVELDPQRLQALNDPDTLAKLDLVQVIRSGRVALFAANLALAAYQRRLAEQLGIEPGAELKRAVALAKERGLPVHLIDREVGLTFKRASRRLGFFGKLKLVAGLAGGLFASEDVGEEEIEKLKQGDMLEASFGEFASESPALYETIIGERDQYMATRLREEHNPGPARSPRGGRCRPSGGSGPASGRRHRSAGAVAPAAGRSRQSATSPGSPWASWRSCWPASASVSGVAAWGWAVRCWPPGRCSPADWPVWAACWQEAIP
jgi:Uncharacterized homolog of PrgY (pheromone shutdown protein)